MSGTPGQCEWPTVISEKVRYEGDEGEVDVGGGRVRRRLGLRLRLRVAGEAEAA